jgi:hypothetical protein
MGFDKSTITKSIITFFIRLNIVNYIPRALRINLQSKLDEFSTQVLNYLGYNNCGH